MQNWLASWIQRYGVSILTVVLTLTLAFQNEIGQPFLLFPLPIMVSAWYGGLGPGLLATVTVVVSDYFFLTPEYSLLIGDFTPAANLTLIVMEGVLLSYFLGSLHSAKRRAESSLEQISTELAQLKQRTAESEASQSLIQAILDYTPTLICVDGVDGRCKFVNSHYYKVFGSNSGNRIGRHLTEFFPPEKATLFLQENQTVAASGKVSLLEEDVTFLDGSTRTHAKAKFPLKDSKGEVYAVGTIFLDIAERKQMETNLRQRNEELTEVSRLKSEFITNMSHELRTPLTSILGFSSVLLQEIFGPLTAKQQEYLSLIRISGTHLLNLINALLDLSKIEAGKLELRLEAVNLAELCQEALQMVSVAVQKKQQQLSLELPVAKEVAVVDRQRTIQMLLNYLSNAVKFTPDGGTITLTTRLASLAELETLMPVEAVGEATCFLVLSVSDTGIGVPLEKQHLLFRLFQQVNGGSDRQYDGTGLGLALTRLLAELHGGTVSFASTPGVGSTFSVWLPLLEQAIAPSPTQSSP